MKKFSLFACMATTAISAAFAQDTPVLDFVPEVLNSYWQTGWNTKTEEFCSETIIEVKFDEDVYWKAGFGALCYVLDSEGHVYNEYTRNFYGSGSDYTKFAFSMYDFNQYEDADYTLVIPENLLGNTEWQTNGFETGRANPELRYEFNPWKMAGCPRENKTVYDFEPEAGTCTLEIVELAHGRRALELQLPLTFSEEVAVHKEINTKCNVRDSKGESLNKAELRFIIDENKPETVIVGLSGVDLLTPADYTISIWEGSLGNKLWGEEDYCEGRSNSPLEYTVNVSTTGTVTINADEVDNSPVYTIDGLKADPSALQKGIYIRNGKKFVVK